MAQMTAFTIFGKLPPELRLEIWGYAVRVPRVIHVNPVSTWKPPERQGLAIKVDGVMREQICPLLLVNRECRNVAKKGLLLFDISMYTDKTYVVDKYGIPAHYFAIRKHDIVHFRNSREHCLGEIIQFRGESENITNVMVDLTVDRNSGWWHWVIKFAFIITEKLGNRQCLENLYCLWWDSRRQRNDAFELDNIHHFSPEQFPKHKEEFLKWERQSRWSHVQGMTINIDNYGDYHDLTKMWKEVSLR
ncbi:hypothetical protein F5Y07DRAFT_403606 [Xylaria sp. FL0933]|nr:hypothetical protein F5Y07DRAFT_403606 [Xylaria sp. FL0933]